MKRVLIACLLLLGAAPVPEVAQRGRKFDPASVTLRRGETVQFVNDDGPGNPSANQSQPPPSPTGAGRSPATMPTTPSRRR